MPVNWRRRTSISGGRDGQIADTFTVRGIKTEDIMSIKLRQIHVLTSFERPTGVHIIYDS